MWILISNGANKNSREYRGRTALHLAVLDENFVCLANVDLMTGLVVMFL